jgi:hypothetical protein
MNFNNRTFHLLQKADILTCYEHLRKYPERANFRNHCFC